MSVSGKGRLWLNEMSIGANGNRGMVLVVDLGVKLTPKEGVVFLVARPSVTTIPSEVRWMMSWIGNENENWLSIN